MHYLYPWTWKVHTVGSSLVGCVCILQCSIGVHLEIGGRAQQLFGSVCPVSHTDSATNKATLGRLIAVTTRSNKYAAVRLMAGS